VHEIAQNRGRWPRPGRCRRRTRHCLRGRRDRPSSPAAGSARITEGSADVTPLRISAGWPRDVLGHVGPAAAPVQSPGGSWPPRTGPDRDRGGRHRPPPAGWDLAYGVRTDSRVVFDPQSPRAPHPGDFEGLEELDAQILSSDKHYNAAARPFDWKFSHTDLNQLLAGIKNHDRHAPHPLARMTPDELTGATTRDLSPLCRGTKFLEGTRSRRPPQMMSCMPHSISGLTHAVVTSTPAVARFS